MRQSGCKLNAVRSDQVDTGNHFFQSQNKFKLLHSQHMSKKMQSKINSVVFLGDSGFPIGLAGVQRITLLGRALIEAGCEVRVVCRMWAWRGDVRTHYGKEGVHEGIHYSYTVDSPFRPAGLIERQY